MKGHKEVAKLLEFMGLGGENDEETDLESREKIVQEIENDLNS